MAKQSGLGDNLYIGGVDVSGDVGSLSKVGGGPALLDVTGIKSSGMERLGGVRDGAIEFAAFFNPTGVHAKLSTLPTADTIVTYARGTTLGNPGAACVAKQINYDGTRGNDGALTFAVQALANGYGVEWGVQATAGIRSDSTATNGSSIDFGVGSTTFGLQAYLHVFAFAGTSVTVKLQGSSDDGNTDAYADITGGAFTAATGITSERIATASNQTMERYLRVVTTGTFSSAQFAVLVVRNETAVTF